MDCSGPEAAMAQDLVEPIRRALAVIISPTNIPSWLTRPATAQPEAGRATTGPSSPGFPRP